MTRRDTLDLQHFEQRYAGSPDPWRYASSSYEAAKYAATLAALPRPVYQRGLDVGCSVGVLTERLAERCRDLLAIEPVVTALRQAQARNSHHAHVRFAPLFVPSGWPDGRFDLVVISEVLDYLGADDLAALSGRLGDALETGGDLVLVHWVGKKGPVPNNESTDELARLAGPALIPLHAVRNKDYRLDVFRRT